MERADAVPGLAGVCGLEARSTREELTDRHNHLTATEVGPEAAVDAEAEGHVAVALAVDDELIGWLRAAYEGAA